MPLLRGSQGSSRLICGERVDHYACYGENMYLTEIDGPGVWDKAYELYRAYSDI